LSSTTTAPTNTTITAPTKLTLEERSAALDNAVVESTRSGWRTLSRTQTQAQLVKGKPTNHILHLILSLITLLWIPVWIGMAVFTGEKQRLVTVDELGLVQG
jgi:hypothetical protein